ncbi:SRPBCC family protein [Actinokineospora sp. NPDC004072]
MASGQTKDVGWNIGVSKTLPHPLERVWAYLVGAEGVGTWLGPGASLGTAKGDRYTTDTGTVGELRSLRSGDRVRLTWRPADWDHDTTVQVTVQPSGPDRTVVRFHQEWLAGPEERERQRAHWQAVMAAVERDLAGP